MADSLICKIENCCNPVKVKSSGMCNMHYKRVARNGAPVCVVSPKHSKTIFFNEVVLPFKGEDCLFWPFPFNAKTRPQMNKESRTINVCREICTLIYGPPPTSIHQAAHSCGKGLGGCVNPTHLRWATPKENCADTLLHGTRPFGERHGQAKLTKEEVETIRYMKGKATRVALAARFNIHTSTVNRIFTRQHWTH